MDRLAISEVSKKYHAVLLAKLASVGDALPLANPSIILEAGETPDCSRARVFLKKDGSRPSSWSINGQVSSVAYSGEPGDAEFGALLASLHRGKGPIAAAPQSLATLNLAQRLASSDVPVLINGPTGTGKEVLARFIHDQSDRSEKPFVAVNCAAIPETMLEAMLFGHIKGAYTGANASGEGFFRAAEGGTLLLDEIAEMPLPLQAKLLRALQEGEVVPVGATKPIKVDVRVLACANRDLPEEIGAGRFRSDLYYRLNVFPLALNALRERPEDIAPLAFALAARHSQGGGRLPWISEEAIQMLRGHGWPGNIRELENVIRRALVLAGDSPSIGAEHIVFDQPARLVGDAASQDGSNSTRASNDVEGGAKLSNIVKLSEARAILDTLESCGGKRRAAAERLGISERTLRYRIASLRDAGLLKSAAL